MMVTFEPQDSLRITRAAFVIHKIRSCSLVSGKGRATCGREAD